MNLENIVPGNGLSLDDTKPLPDAVLTYCQLIIGNKLCTFVEYNAFEDVFCKKNQLFCLETIEISFFVTERWFKVT